MSGELPRQSILIVDDVPANIRTLQIALPDTYEVRVTTGGAEALNIAREGEGIDLILLDIMMPEMDGYEVCRRLKEDSRTRHIPVIFITARSEEAEETKGFALGAVDYITKPFSPDVVRARVTTHLDLKRYRDHLRDLVKARTAALTDSNEQLQWEIAERQRAQEDLKRSHDELERRVRERTAELSESNRMLKEEIRKQEMSIELAKKILARVNGPIPRYIPLTDRLRLFVETTSIPCYAEGGDHCFVRTVEGTDGPRTVLSIKDQSGHEVGCVLRSILTDLLHNQLLTEDPTAGPGAIVTRLNEAICRDRLMRRDDFFTALVAELDHATLILRYLSAGHPQLILIRNGEILLLPSADGEGIHLPLAVADGIGYESVSLQLAPGDRLICYTDGLTEMPLKRGNPMLTADRFQALVNRVLRDRQAAIGRPPPVADITAALLAEVSRLSGETVLPETAEGGPTNTSDDDVTLLCLEIEDVEETITEVFHPRNEAEISRRIDALCEILDLAWSGFGERGHQVRMVLGEAVINAWKHGNECDPSKAVTVRYHIGNDLHLQIQDEGDGVVESRIPDPTLTENLAKPSGRGVFIIRHFSDDACWTARPGQGRLAVTFQRHPPGTGDLTGNLSKLERRGTMELSIQTKDDRAVFTIKGNIDEQGAEELKRRFREQNIAKLKEVVFDFRHVIHIGSAGIGKLLLFYKDLAIHDGRIVIQNASPTIYELFNVLKLNSIFTIQKA